MRHLTNENLTFPHVGRLFENLSVSALVEEAVRRGEGTLADNGALVVATGKYTGRSPGDKFIDDDDTTDSQVDWGAVNQPFDPDHFQRLLARALAYVQGRDLFVFNGYAGADPQRRLALRVVTEQAWHTLFAHQLFIRPTSEELAAHQPAFTLLNVGRFKADPALDGTKSETFIILDFERRLGLIGGTEYAGEIKKAVFSVLNFLLPHQDVLPMHCSANVGPDGDTALFFGLSGTGKTTLSADPGRRLIGDDEHGWGDGGVFNFEGGCYAKCIGLSADTEPQIYGAIRYGTVLENVALDPDTRRCDFADASHTENTRAAYPLEFIPGALQPSIGGHPKTILFLTADAFGVLPPIARLSKAQAVYYFLSGYTSKLAGTERGVKEPTATFSACFGAPFMPLPPTRYAEMLGERLERHGTVCYLVNTGWSGGGYGVGKRMDLGLTRAMVGAALSGALEGVGYTPDPIFGLLVPGECPGVPSRLLSPSQTWSDGAAYEAAARGLARRFAENFRRFTTAPSEVAAAGPAA